MKTEIRIGRLRKLASHLNKGQLGHRHFDFGTYNAGEHDENHCGTSGCAIGECPIVWPKFWMFNPACDPVLKGSYHTMNDAKIFFNLSEDEYAHLFLPNNQDTRWGNKLDRWASKYQVASNILHFCRLAETNNL